MGVDLDLSATTETDPYPPNIVPKKLDEPKEPLLSRCADPWICYEGE